MNLDLDDGSLFHIFCCCLDERDWWGIDTCLKICVDPPVVSELHGWIFLYLFEVK